MQRSICAFSLFVALATAVIYRGMPSISRAESISEPKVPTAQIFVKDLSHLAELTHEDEVVRPMADSLASRQRVSNVVTVASLAAGVAAVVLGFTLFEQEKCLPALYDNGAALCNQGPNQMVVGGGLTLLVVTPIIRWIISPGRNDVLDVLNSWNQRHPDQAFTLTSHGGPR
jgi:hypothetical protein